MLKIYAHLHAVQGMYLKWQTGAGKNVPDEKMPSGCKAESRKDKVNSRPAGFKGKGISRMQRGLKAQFAGRRKRCEYTCAK